MIGERAARATDEAERAAQALVAFGRIQLRLTGTSMLPAIQPGDLVEFRTLHASEARPGEVILYRRGNSLVAHRVVDCVEGALVTQGDALGAPDPLVAHADVLARVVGLTRGRRHLAWGRQHRASSPLARWWFRRFDLATRMWLRWHRLAARLAA